MKKFLRVERLVAVLASLALIAGASWAAVAAKDKVEVIPSRDFTVDEVKVYELNRQPNLEFTITNPSGDSAPGVQIRLTAYNKKGGLLGRQTWFSHAAVPGGSKMVSTLAASPGLKAADRYTVEFAKATASQGSTCGSAFCSSCTSDAVTACGTGKVSSVQCTVGETCSCSYNCKDRDSPQF